MFVSLNHRIEDAQTASIPVWNGGFLYGDGIYTTRHAACPVLVGVKRVANKWLHERGQEFRRPSALGPDA